MLIRIKMVFKAQGNIIEVIKLRVKQNHAFPV